MEKIEKIKLDRGFDTLSTGKTPMADVATATGLLKVMEKLNEVIDKSNE